jgi:hypothetical protein
MTEEHLSLLKSSIDQVVMIETIDGERHLGQILFVFDEGETPDVFYLKGVVDRDRAFMSDGGNGNSVLLSDIAAVYPLTAG